MNSQNQMLEIIAMLDGHGLLDDPWGRSIKHCVVGGYALESDFKELHRRATRVQRNEILNTVPFREPKLAQTGICLGKSPSDRWIYHDLTSSALHYACVGSTGSGKTSVWIWLLAQFFLAGIGFFGLEIYKRDLRYLVHVARRCGRELSVITHHNLRFNPLEPDGVDPSQHLQTTLSQLARGLSLPDRASMMLRDAGYQEFKAAGVFDGRYNECPTLYHLYERIKISGGNAAARDALLDRLGSILLALSPGVLSYHRAWRPSQFLDRLVVLELAGANEVIRQWLPTSWLSSMFHGQINSGVSNSRLRTLCLIDDAQRFLGGDGIGSQDQTPISELLGLLRTTGISVAANYQSFDGVSSGTLANMTGRIIGRLGSASDWKRVAAELALDKRQLAWAQAQLRPGRYMMHLPFSPWRHPFIVDVPRPNLLPVSEPDLLAGRQSLDQLPVIPCKKFINWTPWGGGGSVRTKPAQSPPTPHQKRKQTKPSGTAPPVLTAREQRLLLAIIANPFQPASSYHKACSMKPADAKKARESLIGHGYIIARKARLKSRGRQPLLLEPTPAGIKAAESLNER